MIKTLYDITAKALKEYPVENPIERNDWILKYYPA
jgi:hypothetical protein